MRVIKKFKTYQIQKKSDCVSTLSESVPRRPRSLSRRTTTSGFPPPLPGTAWEAVEAARIAGAGHQSLAGASGDVYEWAVSYRHPPYK